MKLNFKLLLTAMVIASLVKLNATDDSFEEAETRGGTKKIKCLKVNKLQVCGNEEVKGNLTVDGTLTVGGKVISANPIAYGSFYSSATATAPNNIVLTPGVNFPAGAFTPFNNATGTGVTVANAGTYLVWFSVFGLNDVVQWLLNTPAGPVAGSNVATPNDNTFADGFAAVTVSAGDFIIITNNDTPFLDTTTAFGNAGQTVLLTLLRVQ